MLHGPYYAVVQSLLGEFSNSEANLGSDFDLRLLE
jgi:hypothetical protein